MNNKTITPTEELNSKQNLVEKFKFYMITLDFGLTAYDKIININNYFNASEILSIKNSSDLSKNYKELISYINK